MDLDKFPRIPKPTPRDITETLRGIEDATDFTELAAEEQLRSLERRIEVPSAELYERRPETAGFKGGFNINVFNYLARKLVMKKLQDMLDILTSN